MKCPRCKNTDKKYFYRLNNRYYCRKCIPFQRVFIDDLLEKRIEKTESKPVSYHLSFYLSQRQQVISDKLADNFRQHKNSLVLAVCGSGKTEMCFEVICQALNNKQRVCFTIPRAALAKELYQRFKECFEGIDIGLIYGGFKQNENSAFVICTTHQLYRFLSIPFDLILLDEADAFPFYRNEVLNEIFNQCGRQSIKMSATLTQEDIGTNEVLMMNKRYHNHQLPVPKIIRIPDSLDILVIYYLVRKCKRKHQPLLLYVPLKKDVPIYTGKLKKIFKAEGVSSLSPHINDSLNRLKQGDIDCLITTTILERGITIDNVQVAVLHAAHSLYDERTLMQIAGRVGRNPRHPDGFVYFIDHSITKEMKQCISTIRYLNTVSYAINR